MKVKKIFNPQKTISDIIKQVRANAPQEQKVILSNQLEEIKKELKSSDPKTLQIALQKIFFLKMEGIDIRQLDFQIVNCLSCTSFGPKKMACLQVPVSIDPSSQSLFMATNLFKKEIMKSNHVEVSCMLSCVTNIVTVDMGPILVEDAIKILKSNKPLLRKKAMALVAKIFLVCPQTIQGNLENILDSIILKEDNPTVLACFTSIVNCVLNVQPKLYPLFVKPLYELITKQKSNWFLIKMIKTFHKMIKLEPRLVKKLQEIYSNLLTTTNSKALEYELLNSIIEFFKEDASLYELACEKLKIFIEHDDANLQSLGFNLLNKMVVTNPVMINEYKGFLMETLDGTSDTYTKLQILDIFQSYMNKQIYEDFVEVVLKQIVLKQQKKGKRSETHQFMKLQKRSISCIIACTQANDYEYVSDYDWLIETVISCMSKNVLSAENALEIQNLIYDLMVRIDGLSKTIFSLSYQVISELSYLMLNQTDETLNHFKLKMIEVNSQQSTNTPITAQEIIFQTFMFIIGEYSQLMKNDEEVLKLMNLLNNSQLLQIFILSSYEVQTTLLKCIVKYSKKLVTEKKVDGVEKIIQKSIEILVKLYQIQGNNFELDISQNILLRIINPSDDSLLSLISQIPTQVEQQVIERISQLNTQFPEFEPIHPDAQKYVVPIEGIDLNEPIQKNQEEIDKITQKCKEFLSIQGKVKEKLEVKDEEKSALNDKEEQKINQNGENKSDEEHNESGKTLQNQEKQLDPTSAATTTASEITNGSTTKQEPQPAKYTVKKFSQLPNGVNGGVKYNNLEEDPDTDDS